MWVKSELLLLLISANGAPIILNKALGERLDWPLDGGMVLGDGRRLLGSSDTIRGLAGAVSAAAATALLLGHGARTGAAIGFFSMVGDAFSSFVKRRLDLQPGDKATGLDQIPESLLPTVAVAGRYGLRWWDVALLVLAFSLFNVVASRLLYRLHVRDRPH